MTDLFLKCVEVVLKNEGGYQNHPADRGNYTPDGRLVGTKYGIAARFFQNEDIKNLTKRRAAEIYWTHYYEPMNLEGIEDENLVLHVFDFGVNRGKRGSIRTLQRIINTQPDGIVGPITTRKANEFPTVLKGGMPYDLVDFYKEARKAYYINLVNRKPQYKVFLKGWINRIQKCKL